MVCFGFNLAQEVSENSFMINCLIKLKCLPKFYGAISKTGEVSSRLKCYLYKERKRFISKMVQAPLEELVSISEEEIAIPG